MGRFRIVALVAFLTILGSCGGEPPHPTKVKMPPLEKKQAAPVTPAAAQKPAASAVPEVPAATASATPAAPYVYDPQGKPDPFKPLIAEKTEPPPQVKKTEEAVSENAPPLERLDLAQLKLVAIVWGIREPRAMVEDPSSRGYIIAQGTTIGRHKGIVTRITPAGVFINEKYEDALGKFKTKEVTLKLYVD